MLSKKIVKIATGARSDKYVDLFYTPLIEESKRYGLTTNEDLISFLAQIGHETGGLYYVEELASGVDYEGRKDLGNTTYGDGVKYKGRGLIQLTGKRNYNRAGEYLNDDFVKDPYIVSPTNTEHHTTGGTSEEYDNAVKTALWFWRKGSAWGDLNNYSRGIDIEKGLYLGDFNVSRLPNKNSVARGAPFNLRPSKGGQKNPFNYKGYFLVDYLGLDRDGNGKSLFMFELISLGINGGYNGFRDRYEKFQAGREELLKSGEIEEKPNVPQQQKKEPVVIQEEENETNIQDEPNEDKIKNGDIESVAGIENIFPTNREFDINFKAIRNDDSYISEIGKKPFVYLNNVQITEIEKFNLSSSSFLPTISITFIDSYTYFDNLRFPNDDARIKVFIDSRSSVLKSIFMEFKILKFKRIRDKIYQVDGVLNVNRMFTTKIESFGNSSSFEVFKEIAKLSDLGFSTNITNTDDTMTWINPGKRVIEFCRDVLSKSYRSDLSYMWAFVDFYYNINFIDIESQMNFDISKELGLLTADLPEMQNKINTENTSEATSMYLTNDQSAISSSAYFESYRIFNNSTIKSIEKGYATKIKYYDWQSKDFLVFNVDSITDENLILKADDKEFLDENVTLTWEGKQVNDNVHENFHYSTVQNDINLNELQKIGMEIILPTPNFNLYKFQKIFVLLINQGMREINPLVNHKLSGEWIISEVHFLYDKGAFKQKVKLLRRSLGFSQEETSDE